MIDELKNTLINLRVENTHFNTNDLLVHVDRENPALFFANPQTSYPISEFPKRILTETSRYLKETGVNVLCVTSHLVELELGDKQVFAPLVLTPVEYKINRKKNVIELHFIEEEQFINPFLRFHLENQLELSLSESVDELLPFLNEHEFKNYQLDAIVIGNFHHHRYQIVKELDDLISLSLNSSSINQLLGFGKEVQLDSLKLCPDNLFFTDTDHDHVFEQLKTSNLVIQGPPGTGKSQVLSNLLGKLIAQNKMTIVVSEKRAALEVLQKKLSQFNLDRLCFIASSDHLSHTFFKELKSTWDYFEDLNPQNQVNIRLSEQYMDHLQMTLDLLKQENLIGGVSFAEFKTHTKSIQIHQSAFNGQVDSIPEFLKVKEIIASVYNDGLNDVLGHFKNQSLQDEQFVQIDKKLDGWLNQLEEIQERFELTDWVSIQSLTKLAIRCQIFENEYYKRYSALFEPNSKQQKRFFNLRKKYNKLKLEVSRHQQEASHWKKVPSELETKALISTLDKHGLFHRIKLKKWWSEFTHLPVNQAKDALQAHLISTDKFNSLTQVKIDFCDLGIENPEVEVEQLFNTINSISTEEWDSLAQIPSEKRLKITSSHHLLSNLQRDLQLYFNFDNTTNSIEVLRFIKSIFGQLVSRQHQYALLSQNTLNQLKTNSDFDSLERELYASHYSQFKNRFPNLAQFSMRDLSLKIDEIIELQENEARLFAHHIEQQVFNRFQAYHELLNTSSRKLTDDQKKLKQKLRKGKSILVKEFSKSRSHPSLREIYNSEARIWISLLKPIWLSNPVQLAKCFPMEEGLFDVAIFDEASQIPLQNSLGAIHRSKRIIIAGDEHQMGPNTYFKRGDSEPMDLLHQGSYNLKKIALSHHYRSNHPDLIAFSNKHIYNNQLKAFPSFSSPKPIHHIYCEEAVYSDRQNEKEAKAIAKSIESNINSGKTIGVVAFSEEQLNCIWSNLSGKTQERLNTRIEENTAFFKSLENVQGDECDCLFISFGFGKNEEGEFHHRFGPMNTVNGRKRLNVLVTRAKEQIFFFCSIRSIDFKLSSNESVNLLRQWIHFVETYQENELQSFPLNLEPEQHENELTFESIQNQVCSAKELVTLHNVLQKRGWKILYD